MHRFLMAVAGVGALVSAGCVVLSVVWPDWIERVFDVSPDGGDGSTEWGVTAVAVVATLVFVAAGLLEQRRYSHRRATPGAA